MAKAGQQVAVCDGLVQQCFVARGTKFLVGFFFLQPCTRFVSWNDRPAGPLQASDVPVGPGREDFLHTLSGGQQGVDPPVVMMPGYGAGVGFYYR